MEMQNNEIILAEMRPKKRAGRRVFKETRHPVYRGVRRRNGDKWVCELREPKHQRRIWLGTYPTPEMAARAHDVAALALRGRSACLNFADSAWRLPAPASEDPEEIRRVAAEAAELFRPPELGSEEITLLPSSSFNEAVSAGSDEKNSDGFMDDDEVSDMSGMLTRMAEQPLMSPPRSPLAFTDMGTHTYSEEDPWSADMSLWNY